MNVLVANDDGPDAYGLAVLREAAKLVYPRARIITVVPRLRQGGQGMAITPRPAEELMVERVERDFYVIDGKPADAIYLALGYPDRFAAAGRFDLVLAGVNHGQNVGMDVFHSGTVGMAMLASAFFGVPSVAFSQEVQYGQRCPDRLSFRTALKHLPIVLRRHPWLVAECQSVNFPLQEPRGERLCAVSMFSRFRPHLSPHNRRSAEDVARLEAGYITISILQPRQVVGQAGGRRWPRRLDREPKASRPSDPCMNPYTATRSVIHRKDVAT